MSGVPPPPGVVELAHVNVTWIPCSLPNGHPAGAPAGNVVRFRLIPPVPCTKIRNVFPAFALVKLNNASIRLLFNTTNVVAFIRFAGLFLSTANTLVTVPIIGFGVPPGFACVNAKHAPDISRSCGTAQFPSDGVTLNTTGALVPKFNEHVVVRVNGPNTLLSPVVNVVVTVTVAGPPQHAAGNAVPGKFASGLNVPLTRLQFNGVTPVNAITASAIPSPFVSHASDAAVVTVFPGLCSGTPVSDANP